MVGRLVVVAVVVLVICLVQLFDEPFPSEEFHHFRDVMHRPEHIAPRIGLGETFMREIHVAGVGHQGSGIGMEPASVGKPRGKVSYFFLVVILPIVAVGDEGVVYVRPAHVARHLGDGPVVHAELDTAGNRLGSLVARNITF